RLCARDGAGRRPRTHRPLGDLVGRLAGDPLELGGCWPGRRDSSDSAALRLAAVAAIELPGELTDGAVPGADELAILPPHGLEAVHVIERCIAAHHVVELDYVE